MKLKEWAAKQPIALWMHKSGCWYIPDAADLVDRTEAYHLEDYCVSSVIGGTIWFSPRGPSLSMLKGGEL